MLLIFSLQFDDNPQLGFFIRIKFRPVKENSIHTIKLIVHAILQCWILFYSLNLFHL